MGEWKNEDDIKRELRFLTGELKQLREELRDMVAPPRHNPTRAFLQRLSWSAPAQARTDELVGSAEDRKRAAVKHRLARTDKSHKSNNTDKHEKDR